MSTLRSIGNIRSKMYELYSWLYMKIKYHTVNNYISMYKGVNATPK